MALTTGDTIISRSSWVQLESSGASVSAGAMSSACTTECTPTQHEDAPMIEVAIECAFGANTPTEGKYVDVYAKCNDVGADGNDCTAPTVAHKDKYLGSGALKAQSGTQYISFKASTPTKNFDLYVFNGDDADAMTWKLWIRPESLRAKS